MKKVDTPCSDLCAKSATEVVALLRKGEVSPVELIDAAEERHRQVDGDVNAIVTTCYDRARKRAGQLADKQARHGDHPGWLAGLPIVIKDLTAVEGVRSTFGTKFFENNIPEKSESFVESLEDRGGLVIGKTNTPELGAGANTFNAVFGHTYNPHDLSKNPGGSSGGSAAALATGQVWLAHGSDYGGSLRTPAAYCNVVGMRPSWGRLPSPIIQGFNTEAVEGPMARNVTDLALFFDAMCGFDPTSPMSIDAPATSFSAAIRGATPRGLRIAFSPDLGGFAPVESNVAAILRQAMDRMEDAGAQVTETSPAVPHLDRTFRTLRGLSFMATAGRAPEAMRKHFKATIHQNIADGRALTVDDIADAQLHRTVIFHNMRKLFEDHDVLAMPVVGIGPLDATTEYPTEVAGQPMSDYIDWLKFSFLSTVTGLPAMSVPVGFMNDGLPMGIQLIGKHRDEAGLLKAASYFNSP